MARPVDAGEVPVDSAPEEPSSARDAGTDPDRGTDHDAGTRRAAGTGRDAGAPRDAGTERVPPTGSDRTAGGPGTSPAAGRVREPTPLTQQLGRVAIVVIAVLFGIFAVANSQAVDFSWIFGETQVGPDPRGGETGGVPLILLLVASLVMGLALGALIEWQFLRGRRAKKARKADRRSGD